MFAIEREINGTAPQERARVRNALSWRLSITMGAAFCVETLEDALARHGKPEILNTDQGSQFTGSALNGADHEDDLGGLGVDIGDHLGSGCGRCAS